MTAPTSNSGPLIDRTDLRTDPPDGQESWAVVEAAGLVRTYRQGTQHIRAVRGVDMAVRPGEFVAIVGPSGSGKSTLLHLLGGLDRPDAGDVRVDGRSILGLPEPELARVRRRRIGFVLQFSSLLPTLTAAENAAFPLLLDGGGGAFQRAADALGLVGLLDRRDHRPAELSGGEQQRVALARALVTQPAVILADEPTGNLDTASGEEIMKLLRSLSDSGQAILMVTHDPRIAAYVDRTHLLVDGAVESVSIRAE